MCRIAAPAPGPTSGPFFAGMLMQMALAAAPDAGVSVAAPRVSPAPSGRTFAGVDMYQEGESPTFDKLQQDIAGMGIHWEKSSNLPSNNLAQYSPETNTVTISEAAYHLSLGGAGKDELRRCITHELAHARQHKNLVQNASDPQARLRLLADEALKMSQDAFVSYRWQRELEAERTAWEVDNESVNSFTKSQHKSPFSPDFLKTIADQRVNEFATQTKASYEKDFNALYQRLKKQFGTSRP
jgi:hypothetical protein